jgi:hypothetical protein
MPAQRVLCECSTVHDAGAVCPECGRPAPAPEPSSRPAGEALPLFTMPAGIRGQLPIGGID